MNKPELSVEQVYEILGLEPRGSFALNEIGRNIARLKVDRDCNYYPTREELFRNSGRTTYDLIRTLVDTGFFHSDYYAIEVAPVKLTRYIDYKLHEICANLSKKGYSVPKLVRVFPYKACAIHRVEEVYTGVSIPIITYTDHYANRCVY